MALAIFSCQKHPVSRPTGLLGLLLVFACATLAESDSEAQDTTWFADTTAPLTAVEQALREAEEKGTYALIVLGANWCHDSRALAQRLQTEPLAQLVRDRYAARLINVGYYEFGFDVIKALGEPIYYATPTVLVVDPKTRRLVNADNRHQWGDAYNISMHDSVDYFQQMADAPLPEPAGTGMSRQHLNEIKVWESKTAARVAEAYETFGPMIRAYASGDVPSNFRERFREFARFRMSVPKGLSDLQQQAREAFEAGRQSAELTFPELPEPGVEARP